MLSRIAPLVLALLLIGSSASLAQGLEGKAAPDFTLRTIDNQRISLSDFTAKGPVLIDFWATWCQPCKQALPHFAALYEDFKDEGFSFLAISTDNTRSLSKVRPYAASQGWNFPVPLDTDQQVLRRYRGNNIPHTVLVGADGLVKRVWIGYHPGEEVEVRQAVEALLAEAKAEEASGQ